MQMHTAQMLFLLGCTYQFMITEVHQGNCNDKILPQVYKCNCQLVHSEHV